jgi:hypothetical protein
VHACVKHEYLLSRFNRKRFPTCNLMYGTVPPQTHLCMRQFVRAMELDHIGGTFGGNTKPCVFLQLVLKARSSLPLLPRPQARHPPECVYRCLCTDPHLVHTSGVVQCIRTGTIFHSGFNRLCSTQAGLITTSSLNPEPSPLNGLNPTPSQPPAHASSN